MKDLGTVPVMAYALDDVVTFYADGAWWLPCVMENQTDVLEVAEPLRHRRVVLSGAGDVRRLCEPGPLSPAGPDHVQRGGDLRRRGSPLPSGWPPWGSTVFWWECRIAAIRSRASRRSRCPAASRPRQSQVAFVRGELGGSAAPGVALRADARRCPAGRGHRPGQPRAPLLAELRRLAYTASPCPLPALEMLVAEMLAIHFCSDQAEAAAVLEGLLAEVRSRVAPARASCEEPAVRVFWVNPVADLRVMNLLEDAGGRICGTEYLFCHALDTIPEDVPPMEALARTALADPMVGSPADRAERICRRRAAVRGPSGRHFADSRRQPLRPGGRPDRPDRPPAVRRAGHGDRGPSHHRRPGADVADASGGPHRNRQGAGTAMIFAGIDAGSRTLKVVLLDAARRSVVASRVVDQGIDQDRLAAELLGRLLEEQGLRRERAWRRDRHRLRPPAGRRGRAAVTEITCQAWGVRHGVPDARTIIDIGGQDSKLVRLHADGTVADFAMNDRCAAGSGRFLEMLAAQLGTKFTALESLVTRSRARPPSAACAWSSPRPRSSGCWPRGCCRRTSSPAWRRPLPRGSPPWRAALAAPVLFTGGVALVPGMATALGAVLGHPVRIAPQPQCTCALGCALLAAHRAGELPPGRT